MADEYEVLVTNPAIGIPVRPNPPRGPGQNPPDRYIIDVSRFGDATYDVTYDGERFGITDSVAEAEALIKTHHALFGGQ